MFSEIIKNFKALQYTFIFLFFCLLFIPTISWFLNLEPKVELNENRTLAERPDLLKLSYRSVFEFPVKYEAYFNDHFGFRRFLICLNADLKMKIFHTTSNEKVILGKNGWFYFSGESKEFLNYQKPFTREELDYYKNDLDKKKEWFSKRGINFFYIAANHKQSIYPEYLREPQLSWVKKYSHYDDFYDYVMNNSKYDIIIDAKKAILEEKKKGFKVYFQTDTHWNERGAFTAYQSILEKLEKYYKDLKYLHPSDFKIVSRDWSGDLMWFILGIKNLYKEKDDFYESIKRYKAIIKDINNEFQNIKITKLLIHSICKDVNPQKVVVIRDSQFIPIIPWFSETFSEVVYVDNWEESDNIFKIIDCVKPDIVIYERAERGLRQLDVVKLPKE
jgi:hypothetical protein